MLTLKNKIMERGKDQRTKMLKSVYQKKKKKDAKKWEVCFIKENSGTCGWVKIASCHTHQSLELKKKKMTSMWLLVGCNTSQNDKIKIKNKYQKWKSEDVKDCPKCL